MELTIQSMKVQDILRKEAFRRAKPEPYNTNTPGGRPDYNANAVGSSVKYDYPTQQDFEREYYPSSHAIMSLAKYPNLLMASPEHSGRIQMKLRSRVAVAWQQRIHTKRLVALTGFDPDITSSRSKTDEASQAALSDFKEGWAIKHMDTGIHIAISDDLRSGDVALCGYKSGGVFGYRIFSFVKGDVLYPHFDPISGELALFGRQHTVSATSPDNTQTEDISYLDVWDTANYMQYRTLASWEAQDGVEWVVSVKPTPHAYPFCPVAYHRYGGPCWAGSQSLIDQHELALSQLAENNAQYALRILYTLGAEFEMEGSTDGTPLQINGTDPNSKVGFLEPADSSSSFELQLKSLEKEIMRCSFCVETPEIKSGSDLSSLTVKMLFADSYVKALDDAREYQSFIDAVVRIFIEGYGTETRRRQDFINLNVTAKLQPWVFQSETEVVNTVVQLVGIGVLSKQSATEYIYEALGLGSIDEARRLLQEAHDELVLEEKEPGQQNVNVINNLRNAQ